ncbi:MAG TPA: aromatic ring-hydroxylating dioxygenase subunit alpha [Solirubrobacterales bacterium]|nr:aromatic ring-hydroxylating dioxygenase subunit alpha [Solirubrobacterales bacterium]
MIARLPLDPAEVEATLQPLERASMLPPAAFTDLAVLAWELESLFAGGWVCAAHTASVAEPGAYVMREIGDQSFFVIGGEHGRPCAFHNVCRHRGSRLVEDAEGALKRMIRCPYHGWAYAFDGSLRAAPKTDGIENFDPACYGLVPLRTEVVGGLVMVDLGGAAPDVDEHVGDLVERLDLYRVADLVRGASRDYEVEANWKAIAENYSECLHCPGVHPELNALSDYASGEAFTGAGAWCGGSMTLNEGAETMGRDGGRGVRPPIAGLAPDELGSVYYFVLFPNALVSLHPDYVMLHTLWPRDPGRTDVTCEWFFEPGTIAREDFDPSDAVDFWDQVNREDWHVCELAQKGMRSRGYTAGRYTTQEGDVHAFDTMVGERYLQAVRDPVAAGRSAAGRR